MTVHLYKDLIRQFLFKTNPEHIHEQALSVGKKLGAYSLTRSFIRKFYTHNHPSLEQTIHGITFKNPVGLSAGFDKNADIPQILGPLGFGFAQIGTITDKPYEGNLPPRVIRLPQSKGLLVNYGLKNQGVEKILKKIQSYSSITIPLSLSIGKTNSKQTKDESAGIQDYKDCLEKCIKSNTGNFYTINISCPNTFGGEPFTTRESLDNLLTSLYELKPSKPLFLKMPINLPWHEFKELIDVAQKHNVNGVIIGNLNKDRTDPTIKDTIQETQKGSISGLPTQKLSNELIKKTYTYTKGELTIIGVGGIFSAQDAYEKIKSGASLVQLITGMIYEGPGLIGNINKQLVKLLEQDGFTTIHEAIGSHNHNET